MDKKAKPTSPKLKHVKKVTGTHKRSTKPAAPKHNKQKPTSTVKSEAPSASTVSDSVGYTWPKVIPAGLFQSEEENVFHVDFLKNHFRDFARANLFRVVIHLDSAFTSKFHFLSKKNQTKVEMLAKIANLPNFEISKMEIKRMGERFFLPASQQYGDLQITFMSDDAYTQRKFLHSWMQHLVYNSDFNTYGKIHYLKGCKVQVYQLDNHLEPIFGAEFSHCWPSSIGEIQLTQDAESQLTEFPTSFAYSQYTILTLESETDSDSGLDSRDR